MENYENIQKKDKMFNILKIKYSGKYGKINKILHHFKHFNSKI